MMGAQWRRCDQEQDTDYGGARRHGSANTTSDAVPLPPK
jgi:hypothetical protein